MNAIMQRHAPNPVATRQAFSESSQQLAVVETAGTVLAAQAKAQVEARYIVALQRPRSWDQVRQDILAECRRPSFAHNPSAYYRKPIGKGVEGLGIRFVEMAFRCMTNVLVESTTVFEDEAKEVVRVSVTDLESNVTYPQDVRITKTVERSKPMDDGSYISMRVNSFNKPTYTVPAQDDELLNKRGSLISKAVRTLGLRLIPGDIQDEAEDLIKRVRLDKAAKDPAAERKSIADAFAGINVRAADLVAYLGHEIDQCSPIELVRLRELFGAIKNGEATWHSVMENKRAEDAAAAEAGTGAPSAVADVNATVSKAAAKPARAASPADRLAAHLKRMDDEADADRLAELADEPGDWTETDKLAISERYAKRVAALRGE